jgi:hypothetical protein
MVKAILAGTKTQTRRVVTKHNSVLGSGTWPEDGLARAFPQRDGSKLMLPGEDDTSHRLWPKWEPGDRLWVRETWHVGVGWDNMKPSEISRCAVLYSADGSKCGRGAANLDTLDGVNWGRVRQSIFMPRWASRITLEITKVRVERLQDISEADAIAEGCEVSRAGQHDIASSCDHYRHVWQSINGPDSWAENPWVWVIEFRRVQP